MTIAAPRIGASVTVVPLGGYGLDAPPRRPHTRRRRGGRVPSGVAARADRNRAETGRHRVVAELRGGCECRADLALKTIKYRVAVTTPEFHRPRRRPPINR